MNKKDKGKRTMNVLVDKLKSVINNEKILLILFGIYVLSVNIDNSIFKYDQIYIIVAKVIRYTIYGISFIKIIMKIIENKKINLTVLSMSIFFICVMVIAKNKFLITLLLVIILLQDIELKKIVKYCFYSNLFIFFILIAGSIFEVIPNWTYPRGHEIRYSYGYCYPTITSTYFFLLLLMRFYLKNGDLEIWDILFEFLGATILYYATDSRMGYALALIIIVSEIVIKIFKWLKLSENNKLKLDKIQKYCVSILPIVIVTSTLIMLILYVNKSDIAVKINEIMSGRLQLTCNAIAEHGIPLFGKEIKWYGWGGYGYVEQENFKYNFVDIAYFKIIFDNGLIFLVCFLISYTMYMKKIADDNDIILIFVNVIILIWGIIEPNILEVAKNPFIISMVIYIINKGKNIYIPDFKIKNI